MNMNKNQTHTLALNLAPGMGFTYNGRQYVCAGNGLAEMKAHTTKTRREILTTSGEVLVMASDLPLRLA